MPDLHEALREDVEKETPDELVGIERHSLDPVPLAGVLEAVRDRPVVDVKDVVVDEGDSVRVAAEVPDGTLGTSEGTLAVDDPLAGTEGVKESVKDGGIGEGLERSGEAETLVAERLLQRIDEEVAEAPGQHTNGQEELSAGGDPALPIQGEAASGNDAVQVGMVKERAGPGVKDGEEADACSEPVGIAGDRQESLGGHAEEDVVDDAPVPQCDLGDSLGNGEDHVEVGHGQKLALAGFEPLLALRAEALGAVAVPAGVVRDDLARAAIASIDMAAEGGSTTRGDVAHDAPDRERQDLRILLPEGSTVAAEDLSQLGARAGHERLRSRGDLEPGEGREQVQRTGGLLEGLDGDVGVAGSRLEAAVAEEDLDGPDVGASLH